MHLLITSHLSYAATTPCDVLLQVEVAPSAQQICRSTRLMLDPGSRSFAVAGDDGGSTRRWISAGAEFQCTYEARVEVIRPAVVMDTLIETPRMDIPAEVIKYLFPSRYCQSDLFLDFVAQQFGGLRGGPLVAALSDWIGRNFTYDNTASNAGTTATDSFASQSVVCRDYAHVLIALVRAAGLPARMVSAYAPEVVPQDFHAVVEVYLDGG